MENRELLMQLKLELYNLCLMEDSTQGDVYFDDYPREKQVTINAIEIDDVNFSTYEPEATLKRRRRIRKRSAAKIKREREIRKLKKEVRKAEEERLAREEKERLEAEARAREEAEKLEREKQARLEAELKRLEVEEWEKEEKRKERNNASQDSLNFALNKFMKGEAKFYKGKLYVEIFGIFHVWYIKGRKLITRQVNNNNYEGYIKGKKYIEKYHSYFLPQEVK